MGEDDAAWGEEVPNPIVVKQVAKVVKMMHHHFEDTIGRGARELVLNLHRLLEIYSLPPHIMVSNSMHRCFPKGKRGARCYSRCTK